MARASSTLTLTTQMTSYNSVQTPATTPSSTLRVPEFCEPRALVTELVPGYLEKAVDVQKAVLNGLLGAPSNMVKEAREHTEYISSTNSSAESISLTLRAAGYSSRSFAYRMARRMERDNAERECGDDGFSFGASVRDNGEVLSHWNDRIKPKKDVHDLGSTFTNRKIGRLPQDIFTTPIAHSERAQTLAKRSTDSCDDFLESIGLSAHAQTRLMMSDEEFEELPDWSDVEDDPEYNQFLKKSPCWSATQSSLSVSSLSGERNTTATDAQVVHHAMMSDEEFEALPDWSDVEDDPRYNEFVKKSFCWSLTASSCWSIDAGEVFEMVRPKINVSAGDAKAYPTDVQCSGKWW